MKGSHAALRNTADAAALLVLDLKGGTCGIGYVNTFTSGRTFTVTKVIF